MQSIGFDTVHLIAILIVLIEGYFCKILINDDSYLLPKTSIPSHYSINLNVDIGEYSAYCGNVSIDITVVRPTTTLVLHANNLIINTDLSYLSNNNKIIRKVSSVDSDSINRVITLNFDRKIISSGEYVLTLNFVGNVNNYANGLFQSYYTNNGVKKQIIATQFEPVQAREMFPCYDEPNLKSTFKVTVEHISGYSAISNMPVEKITKVSSTKVRTTFQQTPEMSTYLLALAISDFQTLEDSIDGVKIHLYVPPNDLKNSKFALNVTKETIRHLHKILKVQYALPKLDAISVPTFGGGMENWGLIVYDSSVIVNSLTKGIENVYNLVVHEVAHQWFGDLVTLDWWDYVWLNEGFATYYAQRVADLIYPAGRFEGTEMLTLQSLLEDESHVASIDALNTHIEKPQMIMNKFDAMSYHKGSAIVRFMATFFNGYDDAISQYLKEFSYKNSKPNDIFKYLDQRNYLPLGLKVEEVMSGWINNPGYPLLTFDIKSRGNISKVMITQERFLLDGRPDPNLSWTIPITIVSEKIPVFEKPKIIDWLRQQSKSIILNFGDLANYWIIGNIQQSVYCRVNYDLDNWSKIIAYLNGPNFEKIHYLNRMALLSDAYYLAQVKRLPMVYLMNLLKYLKQEKDSLVLSSAQIVFVNFAEIMRETPLFQTYKTFVQKIYTKSRAEDVVKKISIYDLVTRATTVKKRHENSLEDFNNLANRLYKASELQEVLGVLKLKSMSRSGNQKISNLDKIMDQLTVRAEYNQKIKKEFMRNGYNDMKNWLNANYNNIF